MDIQSAITRKVGPLPVWAYGAIVAGIAWLYYLRSGNTLSGSDEGDSDSAITGPDFGEGSVPGNGDGGLSTNPDSTRPTTNQQWFARSVEFLVGFNYEAVSVTNALTRYLQGTKLTSSERALVNQAIARFGAPPEGVPESPGGVPVPPTFPTPTNPFPWPRPYPPAYPKPTPRPPIPRPPIPRIGEQ